MRWRIVEKDTPALTSDLHMHAHAYIHICYTYTHVPTDQQKTRIKILRILLQMA